MGIFDKACRIVDNRYIHFKPLEKDISKKEIYGCFNHVTGEACINKKYDRLPI